ncbi:hypothetical protein CANMA_003958 [Candida margitis]|uniref:uncharacterized protein n=1 Tax=Candida margitis TaxID=1775924 RepID=UPI002227A48A|nr:uncharacterized protein CANMA_003958 [Candida margitis]KAI5960696.1 hypothetical protein CANMA_003958 [Candida margitis]
MSTPSTPIATPAILHKSDATTLPDAIHNNPMAKSHSSNDNLGDPAKSNRNSDHFQINLEKPSTPSPPNRKRASASFLKTPEQPKDANKRYSATLPYTPSYKRTSTGSYKSPDGKLVYQNVNSPFSAAHLLKTPRHSAIEDSPTGEDEDGRKVKMMKTPQYLGTAKKLFQGEDGSPNGNKRDDLTEISSQLRNKLSSALGKLQKDDATHNSKITFTELSFDSQTSPTRKYTPKKHSALGNNWVPTNTLQRANLNLQTLQQSPIAKSNHSSPKLEQGHGFRSNTTSPLKHSPVLKGDSQHSSHSRLNNMPSPDEETSAHSALLAALSRQRRKSRSSFSNPDGRRKSITVDGPPSLQITTQKEVKLPPLNVALNGNYSTPIRGFSGKNNEQDAVISLMSLASPQSVKHGHSRSQSMNSNGNFATSGAAFGDNIASPVSSRSSSVQIPSPTFANMQQPPHLPPLTRFMKSPEAKQKGSRKGLVFASDETDEEDAAAAVVGDDDNDSDRTVEEDK